MNYRHIYHAGNFADIVKHAVLCWCLEKLCQKEAPFFVLDTHAGCGKYDMMSDQSQRTLEAEVGIKKLLQKIDLKETELQNYLQILADINLCEIDELSQKIRHYAGSPRFIKHFLRKDDRAVFCELHEEDFYELKRNFSGNWRIVTEKTDGFHAIKSKLPPLQKRGLVLIDPPFEKDAKINDFDAIISALKESYKRFATAIYMVWYPIINKDQEQKNLQRFHEKISQLKFEKKLNIIFDVAAMPNKLHDNSKKMTACGLLICNAPWQLEEKLNIILPKIIAAIGAENASYKCETIEVGDNLI